jgi:hypothetical protein
MYLSSCLKRIIGVGLINDRFIRLELNDGYSIFVEGSYSISRNSEEIINSSIEFKFSILDDVRNLIEGKLIISARFIESTGNLIIELPDEVTFEAYSGQNDYEAWELQKNEITIYSSEAGTIIYF